jgi:hypothetical protein
VEYPEYTDTPYNPNPDRTAFRKLISSNSPWAWQVESNVPPKATTHPTILQVFIIRKASSIRPGPLYRTAISQVATLHLVHEQTVADPQRLGRTAPVPPMLFESVQDDFGFELPRGLTDSFTKRDFRLSIEPHAIFGTFRAAS